MVAIPVTPPPIPATGSSADARHPLVDALLAVAGHRGIPTAIHPEDEMLDYSLENHAGDPDRALVEYFQSGLRIAASLRQVAAWRFGGLDRIGTLLDFAAGYGRVTRFLAAELPPERIWVAEIHPQAVAFQQELLGVHGVQSAPRPEQLALDRRFDCVFVASLFTHLPPGAFEAWLEKLWSLVAPGGLLVFSTHDSELISPTHAVPPTGILFQEVSESRSLDAAAYGSTWVREDYVRAALDRLDAGGAPPPSRRLRRGLCGFQDLWVAVKDPAADLATLDYESDAEGHIDTASLGDDGVLRLHGWAAQPDGAAVELVELVIDGERAAVTPPLGLREDVGRSALGQGRPGYLRSGWALTVPLAPLAAREHRTLLVRAVTAAGHPTVLWVGSLQSALLDAARTDIATLQAAHDALATELGTLRDHAAAVEDHVRGLQQLVKAMEASRFWKLREVWFRWKRRLGPTS